MFADQSSQEYEQVAGVHLEQVEHAVGQVCPLCSASVDDAAHALVGCTFAGVRNLVAQWHDAAVLDVAGAVRGGLKEPALSLPMYAVGLIRMSLVSGNIFRQTVSTYSVPDIYYDDT